MPDLISLTSFDNADDWLLVEEVTPLDVLLMREAEAAGFEDVESYLAANTITITTTFGA
jgi:hypothetical protein